MKEPSSLLKKREDRASFFRFVFEPVVLELKSANTMMLLLQSEEEDIIIQVQRYLTFISRQYYIVIITYF